MVAPYGALLFESFQSKNDFSSFDFLEATFFRSWNATLLLTLLTAFFSAVWALPIAFFAAFAKIPHKRFLIAILCAPLAAPAYLSGFIFVRIFGSAGDLRFLLAENDYAFSYWADVKSLPGAALILSACFYPYLFLPLYLHFKSASQTLIDYGLSVGLSRKRAYLQAVSAGFGSAFITGLAPTAAETLTDYGVSSYFGVQSLTVFLFDVWRQTAESFYILGVSLLYVLFFVILLSFEKIASRGKVIFSLAKQPAGISPEGVFTPKRGLLIGMGIFAAIPLFLGFFLPVGAYCFYLFSGANFRELLSDFGDIFIHSALPAFLTALISVTVAAIFGARIRSVPSRLAGAMSVLMKSGYALPAVTVGIGVLTALKYADSELRSLAAYAGFTLSKNLIFNGTIALTYAYTVRFFSVALGHAENAYRKIKPGLYDAARAAGYGKKEIWYKIQLPAISGSLLAGAAFVFAEAIKELPLTLLIRPLNYETFATAAYNSASLEQIEQAAAPALTIILTGCFALYFALKLSDRGERKRL